MARYRTLRAWQLAHELALEISLAVEGFPSHERFELASQLRRASLSVPTNLVEGQARLEAHEALRCARMAVGSLTEVDYLLLFAMERGYLVRKDYDRLDTLRQHTSRALREWVRFLDRTTSD